METKILNKNLTKTKKLIWDEFSKQLSLKQKIEKMSIEELVKNTGIDKDTFLSLYKKPKDIAKDIWNSTLDVFFKSYDIKNINDIMNFFDRIYWYLQINEKVFKNILKSYNSFPFIYKLSKMCQEKFQKYIQKKTHITYNKWVDIEVSLFVNGLGVELVKYYMGKSKLSLKQILNFGKLTVAETLRIRDKTKEIDWLINSLNDKMLNEK